MSDSRPKAPWWALAVTVVLLGGCSPSPGPASHADQPVARKSTASNAASPTPETKLGNFPDLPRGALPEPGAARMQAALDETVAQGTIRGATAAVIVAGSGTWAGASGSDLEGNALTAETALDPASTPKTVTAAQVLRLVEQGVLGLDDPAAEHLPGGLGPFTANGATIRHLLGMRSGLTDTSTDSLGPNTPLAERVAAIPPARTPAGPTITYANVNYDLLSAIIENATGQSETTVLEAGVLAAPGRKELEGDDVRAMTLARWGYDLYGGFVLSDASLAQMTDFNGEWYGLGAIDFSHPDAQNGYDPPAVGHGGQSDGSVVRLVAFPDTGIVVAVLSLADDFEDIQPLVVSLRDIAQTTPAPAQ